MSPTDSQKLRTAQQLYRRNEFEAAEAAVGPGFPLLCEQFCARLATLGRSELPQHQDRFPGWLVGIILKRYFRVLAGEECRQYFSEQLLPGEPLLNEEKDWFFTLKNGDSHPPEPALPHLSLHMEDTFLALQAGEPRVFNPLTGALSSTALSLLPDLVLLRDTPESVFVSTAPRPFASSTLECTYVLPERRLILHVRGANTNVVYELIRPDLARAANNYRNINAHALARSGSRGITLADRPVSHLGHYLWNCLSAWETVLESGLTSNALQLASWTEGEFFGNPFKLIPELAHRGPGLSRIHSMDEAVDHIIASNSFWLPMYDRHIRRELATRIVGHCRSNANPAFLDQTAALRQRGGPVILLTVRTGNRAWIDQQAGYVNIICELSNRFPGATFVLDGMNKTHSDSSTHKFMDTGAEMALAEDILSALPRGTMVLNTIGMPIADSIAACELIDIFIAPWGTAMTKYKWVTNKPGVAFGGVAPAGQSAGIGVRVFDRFRDDIVAAVDIPAEHISDAGAGNLDEPLRRNFNLPWQVVLEAAATLLCDLGFRPADKAVSN